MDWLLSAVTITPCREYAQTELLTESKVSMEQQREYSLTLVSMSSNLY